jgi:hypothetical protein
MKDTRRAPWTLYSGQFDEPRKRRLREVVQRALKALASVRITSERSSMKRNGRVIDDSACTSAIAC